jgi:hypothetical protein
MPGNLNRNHVLKLVEEQFTNRENIKKSQYCDQVYHTTGKVGLSILITENENISVFHKGEVVETILVIQPSSEDRAKYQASRIMEKIDLVIEKEAAAI